MNYGKILIKKKIIIILFFVTIIVTIPINYSLSQWQKYKETINNLPYIETIDYNLLRTGDLIFRRGRGLLGQAVLQIDKTSEYSHVGMVILEDSIPFVIHASTGDNWQENLGKDGMVIKENLETFLEKELTQAIAIYRFKNIDDKMREHLEDITGEYVKQKIPFDPEFDLNTKDRLYCTELIWRAYLAVDIDLVDHQFSYLQVPLKQKEYILPGDLLNSKYLYPVYQLKLN